MLPLVVLSFRWFFCLLGCGSFHFVLWIPQFLGALVYYDWQGFIMVMVGIIILNGEKVLVLKFGFK
jgi:hypothetical protein